MFGLDFLFIHALWALPLAGLPILLHLLYRRKSPVVMFSTLRFIKASLQRTAARRRLQRWLLLACRALLLLLLIWAIAQPAKMLASAWFGSRSTVAAIVVDTSYSMLLEDQQVSLLDRASSIVEDLLRNELDGAQVAVLTSQPTDDPVVVQSSTALLSQWTPLTAQPSPQPLLRRVGQAIDLLRRQEADQKWLIVISDLHSHEFPQPIEGLDSIDGLRVAMIDLQPAQPRNAGITGLSINPRQPIPGITSEVTVEVAGRAGDARPLVLTVETLDGQILYQSPATLLRFDSTGRARLQRPVELPAQRWLNITATLQADDASTWDNRRSLLVEVPPKQKATVLVDSDNPLPAARFAQLALDPSEGRQAQWPIEVKPSPAPTGDEDILVALWPRWPDGASVTRLRDFARNGGTVLLFLQPGLETTWNDLDDRTRSAIAALLPGQPMAADARDYTATPGSRDDPLITQTAADAEQLSLLSVRRFVPMAINDPAVTALLRLTPRRGTSTTPPPLLAMRRIGSGRVFTWSTFPEPRFTNLPLHPIYLQLMVLASLPPRETAGAQNIEIGQPLRLAARRASGATQLDIENPRRQITRVPLDPTSETPAFTFTQTAEPGTYTWRLPDRLEPLAMAEVHPPSAEADLTYRPADSILAPADNVLVATSLADLRANITQISEPSPRWSWAIALVLFLLCLEALMSNVTRLWNPVPLRSFLPRLVRA